ncbi:unnamed protein product [Ectocarpus sp. 12 AP-2014]
MPQARRGGGGRDALFTRKSGIEAFETMRRKEERRPQAVNSGESCGTWVASDACDEDRSSDDGGGDCDPGSQRLRALLLEAKRAASESAPSSWCEEEEEEEEEEEGGGEECGNGVRDSGWEIEQRKEDRPRERVVGRAASAPRLLQSGGTPGTTHGGVGGVCRGRDDGRGAPPAADGDGDDQDGAAALLAALEDVLLCPPQVLARGSSCGGGQGRAPSLSSLLTRASKPRDGRVDGSGGGDDPGAGEGGDEEEKEADAAEAAVKAALAWKVPSRRLSCVLEESGPAAGGGGGGRRAEPAATVMKGNGDRVKPKSIPKALPDEVSYSGGPAFFSPSEDDDGDAGGGGDVVVAGFGEEGGKGVVSSGSVKDGGGGGGIGPTPPRRGSGSGSGESESTQSVGVGSTAIMTTPSRSPMSKGDEDRERPALATAAGGGDGGGTAVVTREVSEATKFGDDSDHNDDDDDDDDSGPVVAWPAGSSATEGRRGSGVGGGGNAGRGSFTSVASSARSGGEISFSDGRVRQGGEATKSSGGDSPSLATRMLNREARIRTVFGQKAVEAAAATVAPASGSDSSSQLLLAAANRISALPAQERSLLAELDRASDVDEGEGDGDGGGGGGGFIDDTGVVVAANGDKTNEGVISSPHGGHEDGAPASPSLSDDGNPARESAEPKLLRVGSGGGDGGGTTPFRYRRLMGLSRRGWPSCVNPARREEWLCPVEFEAVFAMSFSEFRALPSWKRVALKRELLLF